MGACNASERGGKISPWKQLFASNTPMSCFFFQETDGLYKQIERDTECPQSLGNSSNNCQVELKRLPL